MQVNGNSGMSNNMHSNCNMKEMHGVNEGKSIEVQKTKINGSTGSQVKANNRNEALGSLLDLRV